MFSDRIKFYKELEEKRGSKVISYITGDRQNQEVKIASDVWDFFSDHLDTFCLPKKISLLLYSRGGDTLAGWMIVNMIRLFCDEFEVIVPSKAHSTATLICLGADKIIMTKQATLGPIDPSITTPLNPEIPGAPKNIRLPISVEAVANYFEMGKKLANIKEENNLTSIFLKLADQMHPVALGNVFRARTQIQMLAEKLLSFHIKESDKIKKIISVLCSESGSHDYTINRREAKTELQLPIEKPDDALYNLIKNIYLDIRNELKLNMAFDPSTELGTDKNRGYSCTRGLIESIDGGSHKFITEGKLKKVDVQTQAGLQELIHNTKTFEGWRHEKQ